MIDARKVLQDLRLPAQDEAEVQRLGGEIVAAVRSKDFDGRPFNIKIPVADPNESDQDKREEQHNRTYRIACAIQRRFQANLWTVNLETLPDAFGQPSTHSLWFAIDSVATRPDSKMEKSQTTPVEAKFSLRSLYEELSTTFGGRSETSLVLPAKPEISIILGTFNRLKMLQAAVNSIRQSVGSLSYEICVTDGGSVDGSRAWLASQRDVVMVGEWRLDGATKAFNQAFAISRGEFIANLNDDCVVHGNALADGVAHLRKNPRAGQVAFSFSGVGQSKRGINDIYPRQDYPRVTWGTTYANFGIARRDVAVKVAAIQGGGFWNTIYRTYAADCEFSAWVWKLGYTVDKMPDCYVEDVWAEDDLRAKNSVGSALEAKKMYSRWPAASFKPDGPEPRVSVEELERYLAASLDFAKEGAHSVSTSTSAVYAATLNPFGKEISPAPSNPIGESDTVRIFTELVGFPEPQEERRLRKVAPLIRALDPIDTFPKRAEKLSPERVLHIHINGEKAVDQQEGLVRALKEFGPYEMVRWTDFEHAERQQQILAAARRHCPTLIFMQIQTPGVIDTKTIQELREICPNAVIITWNGDIASENAPWRVDEHVAINRMCDLALHSSLTHVHAMRAAGVHNAGFLNIGLDSNQYCLPSK